MSQVINLVGKQFGKWKVLDRPPVKSKKGYYWICKCACGTIKPINSWELRNNRSTSCGCSIRLPKGESACKWLYNYYKKTCAKSRGHKFELTLEDFRKITKQNCSYCSSKPKNIIDRSSCNANGVYIYNGIDRKDNTKGYTKENCVPCCKICNSMKSKLSEKDFLEQVSKIYKKEKERKK